jgi:hypothetical protein
MGGQPLPVFPVSPIPFLSLEPCSPDPVWTVATPDPTMAKTGSGKDTLRHSCVTGQATETPCPHL